jgi:hypothetical protein
MEGMAVTYTLAMASDLEPRIAEDGIQDVPLTRARALLTRLIEQAREDGLVSAFTVRGRRRAYLVTPAAYQQAQADRRLVQAFTLASEGKTKTLDEFLDSMNAKLIELVEQETAAGTYPLCHGPD